MARYSQAVTRHQLIGRVARSSGGKRLAEVGQAIQQYGDEEFGVNPTPRQPVRGGREGLEMQQAFEPFEDEFDLPAQAVQRHHPRGGHRRGQRGDEERIFTGLQGAGVEPAAAPRLFLGGLVRFSRAALASTSGKRAITRRTGRAGSSAVGAVCTSQARVSP